jgi:hypothetical protein
MAIYHIVNGDVVGDKIKSLDGEVIVWREMFDLGPIYPEITVGRLVERAFYFDNLLQIPHEIYVENTLDQEEKLMNIPTDADVVLWFEHDRYDQTMLLYLLNKLSEEGIKQLSMVSLDSYPGIEPFLGMGQLTEEQLVKLYEIKKPLTTDQISQGVSGWKAYSSDDPGELERWMAGEPVLLPYVHRAFRTHYTYFPSTKNGLNQIEELALQHMNDEVNTFKELFRKVSNERSDDGLSNLHFSALMAQLAKGKTPLISVDGELPNFTVSSDDAILHLTGFGEAVIKGELDRVDCCDLDWWLGGVHLSDGSWRWDGTKIIHK